MQRRKSELGVALATGLAGGVLLGAREGLATLSENAFANPASHSLAYLLAPIAVWSVLGCSIAVLTALVTRVWGGGGVATYASVLAGAGTALALVPWISSGFAQMRATGAPPSMVVVSIAMTAALGLSLVVASIVGSAVRACTRWSTTSLALAVSVVALVAAGAWAWTGHVVASSLETSDPPIPATHPERAPPAAVSVLFVSIDTLRADALGAYGSTYRDTPALDRLAADGVAFERAMTPAPWTLPAIASAMTGLLPRRHGAGAVTNRWDPLGRSPLHPALPTLAATLRAAGWRTEAIVTNPYLLPPSGLAAGFDRYRNLTFQSEVALAGRMNAGQWLLGSLAGGLVAGDRGSEVSDRAIRWIDNDAGDRPFFLWLHYIDPHGPYGGAGTTRHKSFRGDSFFGAAAGTAPLEVRSPEPVRLRSGEVRLGPEDRERVRALYRSEVAEVDRQVGRVLDAIDTRGLRESTVVVVLSDHGEEFWEHGGVEHGHTLYDEVLRVVLLLRWPGKLPAGARVGALASLVDVVPTLHDLLGLAPPAETDGVSLVPAIRGEAMPPRAVLSENLLFAEERVAVRTERTKLVRWANGKEEAYDLVRDPAELRDLAGVEDFVSPLRAAFAAAGEPSRPSTAPAPIPVEALRALGYVR